MILCVTPNVALDRTLIVPGLSLGKTFHPTQTVIAAGGKGVNVARVVRLLGGDACCAGLLGGHSGRLVAELAEREWLHCIWTWTQNETRTCTILVDPNRGQATGIYEIGDQVSSNDWDRLQADVLRESGRATDVCVSGTLPNGIAQSVLGDFISKLQAGERRVWIDTSGAALQGAIAAKPFAIKINSDEAGEILGRNIENVASALDAADEIRCAGTRLVALTLDEMGAILISANERWHAQPPAINASSSVGSGDAFLAALVTSFQYRMTLAECLQRAVAAGTANALSIGGGRFTLDEFSSILKRVITRRC